MILSKAIVKGFLAGIVFTLTACGSGEKLKSLDELVDQAISLEDRSDKLFDVEGYSDPSQLPTSDTATYTGFIKIEAADLSESFFAVGELELIADFNNAGSISGTAKSFVGTAKSFVGPDEYFGGELGITNGSINRAADLVTEYTFGALIDGTLTTNTDDYLVDAFLDGDFVGNSQEFVHGHLDGTIDSTSSLGTIAIGGIFDAER